MRDQPLRLFIANRGEIAVRIVAACRKLGWQAVMGVSEADKDSLGARLADRAVCLGPARATESYLNQEAIVAAALGTGCSYLHPGYGFLSERPNFRRLCELHGLTFVGPSAEAMEAMGDKLRARAVAAQEGVPVVPGCESIDSVCAAHAAAAEIGYPLLLKASAGGGGRGMRIVRQDTELGDAFISARAEAEQAFGDPTLYIERYIEHGRHIEIQILGDAAGNLLHLFERDCSIQRRHQKLIEEAPSPVVDSELRRRMTDAALRLARRVRYTGAGTVEFILDLEGNNFYFLEMNTRIQVEHPVTEMVTGIDLVAQQMLIATGKKLPWSQNECALRGHAIEFRINAEDPAHDFRPSPGRLTGWAPPSGEGVRIDSHCYPGYFVPPFYDSMIAKLIVHAEDRNTAIARGQRALGEFDIGGIKTTVPFHQAVLAHEDFRRATATTRWVETEFKERGDRRVEHERN